MLRRPPNVPAHASELADMLREFSASTVEQASWSAFAALWQRRVMASMSSEAESTLGNHPESRLRLLYAEACALLTDTAPLVPRMAAVYALYALHSTQICDPLVPVPLLLSQARSLAALRLQISRMAAPVPAALLDVWRADAHLLRNHIYCCVAPGSWVMRPSADEAARLLAAVAREAGGDAVYQLSDATRLLPRSSATHAVIESEPLERLTDAYLRAKQTLADAVIAQLLPPQQFAAAQVPALVQADLPAALAAVSATAQQHRDETIELDFESKPIASTKKSRQSAASAMKIAPPIAPTSPYAPPVVRRTARTPKPKRRKDYDEEEDDDDDVKEVLPPPVSERVPARVDEHGNRVYARDVRDRCGVCDVADDGVQFFIGCEACERWFHGDCVEPHMTQEDAAKFPEWYCSTCRPRHD